MGSQGKPNRDNTPADPDSAGTESVPTFAEDDDNEPVRFPDLPPGTVVAGRYIVRDALGRGGYAVVYKADDKLTGAALAIKILREERLGRVALKRLAREAETAKQFQHERLVKVLDSGVTGENAFLVMELIEGQTLRARREEGPLATNEAVDIARDVLEALAALHKAGVVHRDVKPSNILLDRHGRAKLADFGLITRWSDDQSRATQSHAIVGTVEYVSPEQALGEELDGRSDLYSLGVVLFEMLSGAPLHGTRSSLGMLVAHLTKPAPDIRAARANVPDWLAAVVSRLLEKDRNRRYPSAEAALADIDARRPPRTPAFSWKKRANVAGAALVASVALFLAWQLATPKAALISADVKGGVVRGLDVNGEVLWTWNHGEPLDDVFYAAPEALIQSRLRVADLEGDGTNEVLLIVTPMEGAGNVLVALESDGHERFRRIPGRPLVYGAKTYDAFTALSVSFFVDSKNRRRLFLLSGNRAWFPSVLEELDRNGRLLNEYAASGSQVSVSRINFGGEEVLALVGFHNETRGGSLTLLSLDNPSGRAPSADPQFLCATCPPRDPLAILITPRADLLPVLDGPKATASIVKALTIDGGVLDLSSRQGVVRSPDGVLTQPAIAYRLAADISAVVDTAPSHELTLLHDRLYKEGRLDHPFGERDLAELRQVRKWDGTRWVVLPSKQGGR